MIDFDYYYRRRYLDGSTGISITTGPALDRCDDEQIGVFDYMLTGPVFATPVAGRRGTTASTIARPTSVAARLWLWPARSMRLLQQFDQRGQCSHFRIDFATPPRRDAHSIYQTDLYLDLFVAPNGSDYVITDEDELAEAVERGMISSEAHAAVIVECDHLVQLLEHGQFLRWLDGLCDAPFELEGLSAERAWQHREFAPGASDDWPAGAS